MDETIKTVLKISEVKNNPNNPRLIKDDKFKKLVQSLKDFPIMAKKLRKVVVDENNIILGGNMRFKAIKEAGMKEVHVEYFTREDAEENNRLAKELNPEHVDKTYEEQCREFVIKDNVSGGEWDWNLLANEWNVDELNDWGLDTPDDWAEETEIEEDEAPEVSDEPPVSKLGEVYQLGRHRVMCGDSTNQTAIDELLQGVEPDMVFTDPPYGMNYSGRGENTSNTIMGDDIDPTDFYNVGTHIKERYVWGRVENYKHLLEEPRDTIIWKKNNFGMGRGYRGQYECCFYYGDFSGSDSDVWDFAKDTNYEHPTQKPVGLAARAIKNSQPKVVIDYFLGSGSTLIACEQTDRTCYGMELDEKYVDVVRKRYHKFVTGSEEGWQEATPAVKEIK